MTDSKSDSESILLVDDEPTNLQVLFETLDGIGRKKLIAKDGKTALSIARKAHPELILLDIMMPGMDGFEVCRQLKSDPNTRDIPVIFLSALSGTEDKVHGLNLGAVDYVTKPFQPEEVIARVNTHLTIHRLNREVQNQKDKLEHELKIVSDLQRKLLPGKLPEISGLRLAVYYETSLYSGGDYYDVVQLPNNCWGFLMADAAGHGAPAAVEMAMTCTLFRSFPEPPVEPARVLSYLNRNLRKIYETSYVTAIYLVYDSRDRILRIARAGQPPPMVYRSAEEKAIELACAGVLPLGIESYEDVPVTETKMTPGDRLLLYTDGITERFNNDKQQYSEERLLKQLQMADRPDPQRLLDDIMNDVEQFAGGRAAEDDQALFLVVVE
jgi:sigma-B regulation protein RsbU (phosphoserine phosphatase)